MSERTYTRNELEEAMKNIASATAELTKNTVVEELKEKGLLKEETEPGTTKKLLAGLLHRGTKGIKSFVNDTIKEGENTLITNALLSADEKAKARRIKEAMETIEKEFPTPKA